MNAKKTALGITGAAAVALLSMGAVAPAMADDNSSSSSNDTTSSVTKILGDLNLGDLGDLGLRGLDGGVGNGASIGGFDGLKDIGNLTTTAPVVIAPQVGDVASGNSVGANVSDLVDSSIGDITGSVSDIVGDATSSVDLGAILTGE